MLCMRITISFLFILVIAELFAQNELKKGDAFYQKEMYAEALLRYEQFNQTYEDDPTGYYRIGLAQLQLQNYPKAIESFTWAYNLGLHTNNVRMGRAKAYMLNKEYDNALRDYDKVLDKEMNAAALLNKAIIHYRLDNYLEAVNGFSDALELGEYDPEIFLYRAHCYRELKKPGLALSDYKHYISYKNDAHILYLISRIETSRGSYDTALYYISKAIKLKPKDVHYYDQRAWVYVHLNEYEKAINDLDYVESIVPKDVLHFVERGTVYHHLNHYEMAIRDFDKAIALSPSNTNYYMLKSASEMAIGYHKAAIKTLSRVIMIDSSLIEAYLFIGDSYYELKNLNLAEQYYSLYLAKNETNYTVYRKRADVRFLTNNFKEAIEDYTVVLNLHHQHPGCYYKRGVAHLKLGNHVKGCEDFQVASEMGYSMSREIVETHCESEK